MIDKQTSQHFSLYLRERATVVNNLSRPYELPPVLSYVELIDLFYTERNHGLDNPNKKWAKDLLIKLASG
jgi:hypothetical protein